MNLQNDLVQHRARELVTISPYDDGPVGAASKRAARKPTGQTAAKVSAGSAKPAKPKPAAKKTSRP